jgi:glyoxylase-like metal-dependent hydrolase (beta-lactamase superfamily II)
MRHASRIAGSLLVVSMAASATPAFAQIDLSGEWAGTFYEDLPHRGGMQLADYTGLPLNEAGWRKAHSWDEAVVATHERQCIPHVANYALRGPATIRFAKVVEPDSGRVIAYNLQGSYGRPRTIWMDGRAHPSDLAPHTWGGFSTGNWERNALVVSTTHIKMGWLQRNGAPTSDLTTMTEQVIRHGDYLMVVTLVNDPVFLSEPFIRTTNFVLSLTANANSWGSCGPQQTVDELPGASNGYVPHHLPGDTAHIEEFSRKNGVPLEGARGGADTTYPEYAVKVQQRSAAETDRLNRAALETPRSENHRRAAAPSPVTGDIRVVPVQGNVYLLAGAGGNMAVQIGEDGVLLVDTGAGTVTDKVLAAIRQLSDKPIRFILNTNATLDRMGGNASLAVAGRRAEGGRPADSAGPGAMVMAHEAVLRAVSVAAGQPGAMPVAAWPTDTYSGETKDVSSNGEAVQLFHQPAANTDGDTIVLFRRSDVVVTGDIFLTTGYPVIDAAKGGSFRGVIAGLNHIIDLTVPRDWQEGGTMVIPGQGRVADESDVVEYRDMLTIIRDRIEDMIKKGMTLAQVQAARPTFEYDGRYGSETGSWTTALFVEAAYRDLSRTR